MYTVNSSDQYLIGNLIPISILIQIIDLYYMYTASLLSNFRVQFKTGIENVKINKQTEKRKHCRFLKAL